MNSACTLLYISKDLDSCRLRLDPELGRHRYERKISFAGILDDDDGHDSLNSSSHTLKSDTAFDDKRNQEAMGESHVITFFIRMLCFVTYFTLLSVKYS